MMAAFDAPQFRDDVVNLLKVFDCDVQGVEVYDPEGTRSYIRVWHKRTGYMPIAAFGDGFRRVLTYALAVIGCRNGGVLLIDEIETAIHYSALRKVYRWLVEACAEHRVQLFVTTHSLEAIDALLEATPETMDTSFYRLHEERGAVSVVRFDEPELRALREQFGDEVRG
jgi:predicted ATPase